MRGGLNYNNSSNRGNYSSYADDNDAPRSFGGRDSGRGGGRISNDDYPERFSRMSVNSGPPVRGTSEPQRYTRDGRGGGREPPSGRNGYGNESYNDDQRPVSNGPSYGNRPEANFRNDSMSGRGQSGYARDTNNTSRYAEQRFRDNEPTGNSYGGRNPPRSMNQYSENRDYGRSEYQSRDQRDFPSSGGRGGHLPRGTYNNFGNNRSYDDNPSYNRDSSRDGYNNRPEFRNNDVRSSYENDRRQYNDNDRNYSSNARGGNSNNYGSSDREFGGSNRRGYGNPYESDNRSNNFDGPGFGGSTGRGGSTMPSSRGSFGVGSRFDNMGSRFDNQRGGTEQTSRFDSYSGGSRFDSMGPDARAPRYYKPVERNVRDIFDEDRKLAERDNTNLEDDSAIEVIGVQDKIVCETWEEMGLDEQLYNNITQSYIRPRRVQQYTIPYVMDGYDCKVQCETGSGKTAAFLVPIVNDIIDRINRGDAPDHSKPLAVIVCPTRELCNQLYEQAKKFTNQTSVKVARCYGEFNMRDNMTQIRDGCHIICACLGRLLHFVSEGSLILSSVRYIVLDEADRLLNENMNVEVTKLMSWNTLSMKDHRQTLLFSATLADPSVQQFANNFLKKQKTVEIRATRTSNSRVMYDIKAVPNSGGKHAAIVEYVRQLAKDTGIPPRILVFVNRKVDTDMVSTALSVEKFNATTIHGDRGQHLREEALSKFRSGECRILVATDVCARGVDIKDLDYVINFDLPNDESTFVQRCGRTGRTHSGTAASFYDQYVDGGLARSIANVMQEAGQEPPGFLFDGCKEENYKWIYGDRGSATDDNQPPADVNNTNQNHSNVINDQGADDDWD